MALKTQGADSAESERPLWQRLFTVGFPEAHGAGGKTGFCRWCQPLTRLLHLILGSKNRHTQEESRLRLAKPRTEAGAHPGWFLEKLSSVCYRLEDSSLLHNVQVLVASMSSRQRGQEPPSSRTLAETSRIEIQGASRATTENLEEMLVPSLKAGLG